MAKQIKLDKQTFSVSRKVRYLARVFEEGNPHALEGTTAVAEEISGRYHMYSYNWVFGRRNEKNGPSLGTVDTIDEAERILHEHCKNSAESMAKKYRTRDLVDFTELAPEPLPRGGK